MSKSSLGIPGPRFPTGIDLDAEARKGRRRLYPVSLVYSTYALAVLALGLRSSPSAVAFFALGVMAWTYLEYFTHRYVLHGIFPDGPRPVQQFLHARFDDLHWRHHLHPWNGEYINGTFEDTLLFAAALAALSFLAPLPTAPAFIAGVIGSYVFEEWVHHSVHFYTFRGRYFRYIKRHHWYHHSPRGRDLAFGLTSGIWDLACGTRIPAADRRLLYR